MDAATRERELLDAQTNEAPNIPGLKLRPFNDGTLGLCEQLGLSLFTLEALISEGASASGTEADRAKRLLAGLGFAEVNRQCHIVFFMLGQDLEEMLRVIHQPDVYKTHVLPWLLKQQYPGSLVPMMIGEWQRFMRHFLAASVRVLPRSDAPDDTPKNS